MSKCKIIRKRRGVALIMSILFLVIFAALGVGWATMSNANVQIAKNQGEASKAYSNAFSGINFIRKYLENDIGDIVWPQRLDGVYDRLTSDSLGTNLENIDDVSVTMNSDTIYISDIYLDEDEDQKFDVSIFYYEDPNSTIKEKLLVTVTGKNGNFTRSIESRYDFQVGSHSVFDYGVATKGPLSMVGQAEIDGTSDDPNLLRIQAGVYIEGVPGSSGDSLTMTGKSSIAGDVKIYDPDSSYSLGSKSVVGGADAGSDEYIDTGVDFVDFPIPYPQWYESWADGDVIDQSNYSSHSELVNCTVAPGADLTFASDTVIKGILYIKSPNKIKFAGKVTVYGMIVCEGDYANPVSGDEVKFSGQVTCVDTAAIAGEDAFVDKDLSELDGTFLLAPGFEADFSGQSNFVNGAIAASGIGFTGQAGGIIDGSIINYSSDVMDLSGQSELIFNRSGTEEPTAGFVPYSRLLYIPESYNELRF